MADSKWSLALGTVLLARWLWRRRRRMNFRGKSVVITGGSRGLGLEMARRFAAEGARLTLLARDGEELERARMELTEREGDVRVRRCDVTDPNDAKRAIDYVIKTRGRIDVLINNAGVIQVGPFENMTLADFEDAMKVHAWGPLHLIRAAVPYMRWQKGGRIVNITSVGAVVAVPHLLPYCMSKFALHGLSEGLRSELAGYNIRVTTVVPGLMRTGSHVNAFFKGQHEKEFAWFALSAAAPLLSMSSARAAAKIVRACRDGRARITLTPQAKFLHVLDAVSPGMTAAGQTLFAGVLPRPVENGDLLKSGWESRSEAVPEILTRLADRAIERNNERRHTG